jgi:hypothetical protein
MDPAEAPIKPDQGESNQIKPAAMEQDKAEG